MSEPTFPIMSEYQERRRNPDLRRSIPWAMIAPHEAQAQHNHSQTLQRLAERGGLSPNEAVCVLEDRRRESVEPLDAWERLEKLVQEWR